MKIFAKFKIILLAMTSIVSLGTVATMLNGCGGINKTYPINFDEFKRSVEKATPFDIVANATPKIWTTATPSQLSANKAGFQVKENVSISIQLIFTDNSFIKHNPFTILFNHKGYDATNWTADQASDFIAYKTAAEKGGAAKVWGTIYNYYATNKKYLPNINFTTSEIKNYQPEFSINGTTFFEDAKNHTVDLQVTIIEGKKHDINPAFSYVIHIIATWSGREFSISDWTSNYDFSQYTTTLSSYLTQDIASRTLMYYALGVLVIDAEDLKISKPVINQAQKTIDVTYTWKHESKTIILKFQAKMVTDSLKRVGLFGYNEIYGGKSTSTTIGDIHWLPPYPPSPTDN